MTAEGSHIEAVGPGLRDAELPWPATLPKGPRCVAIIAAQPASQAAGLEAAAAMMANGDIASVRVGNPLNSPLTLQRILFQMDLGGTGDDAAVDDEAHLARLLEERRGAQDRLVLVVERAETLDQAALLSLQRLASAPGAMQVLFVGGPAFWALLDDAELAPLRRVLTRQGTEPAVVTPPAPATPIITPLVAPVRPSIIAAQDRLAVVTAKPQLTVPARSGRRWWMVGAAGLVITTILGTAAILAPGGLFYRAVPQRGMPTPPREVTGPQQPSVASRLALPTPTVVAAPPPQVATPVLPSTAHAVPPVSLAPLPEARAKTQQTRPWLEAAPSPTPAFRGADVLTGPQRDQGDEQVPSWRSRVAAHSAAPSPSEGRVVIHYRTGSVAGEAEAGRLATVAAPLAARVQTRVVTDMPSAPVIRFFHPEDEARARRLAGTLSGTGPGWDVKDFGSFRPRPSPGTIEVWTPTR